MRCQGLLKIFRGPIYRAHRAVSFAIAHLSCYGQLLEQLNVASLSCPTVFLQCYKPYTRGDRRRDRRRDDRRDDLPVYALYYYYVTLCSCYTVHFGQINSDDDFTPLRPFDLI